MTVAPTPQYLREFPAFGILDVQLPAGFEDQSSAQDSCPRFELGGPDYLITGEAALVIFIDYKEQDAREFSGGPRFLVYVGEDRGGSSLSTDDWDEVLRFVAERRDAA